jgi:hypothetical protein
VRNKVSLKWLKVDANARAALGISGSLLLRGTRKLFLESRRFVGQRLRDGSLEDCAAVVRVPAGSGGAQLLLRLIPHC